MNLHRIEDEGEARRAADAMRSAPEGTIREERAPEGSIREDMDLGCDG